MNALSPPLIPSLKKGKKRPFDFFFEQIPFPVHHTTIGSSGQQ